MNDILRSIEQGERELTPRAKHRIYSQKPLTYRGKPVNKVLAGKQEQEEADRRAAEEDKQRQA